jgi:phage shock protein C
MNRRLVRSRTDRVIGGVAAGLADYLNADPALVRIAWALLIPLTGGAALLAYIVAWIVVPEATPIPAPSASAGEGEGTESGQALADTTSPATRPASGESRAGLVVGTGLVLIGVWFLVREYLPDIDWSLVWPAVLIGIGAIVLVATMRRRPDS